MGWIREKLSSALFRILPEKMQRAALYEAAKRTRLNDGWSVTAQDINHELLQDVSTLRYRSRYLFANNPIIRGGIRKNTRTILRRAIWPVPAVKPKKEGDAKRVDEWNRKAKALFDRWYDDPARCCLMGRLSGPARQRLILQTRKLLGECFVIRYHRDNGIEFPSTRLHVVGPDALAQGLTADSLFTMNGRPGIEYDKDLRPTKYHFFAAAIYNSPLNAAEVLTFDAKDVLHLYMMDMPGQIIGEPILASVGETSYHLGRYLTATIQKAETLQGVLAMTKSAAGGFLPTASESSPSGGTRDVFKIDKFTVLEGLPGDEFTTVNAGNDSAQFDPVSQRLIQWIAVGIGESYANISGDYRNSTYSSGRQEADSNLPMANEDREEIRDWDVATEYAWFLEDAIFEGKLPILNGYSLDDHMVARYRMPGDPYINPIDEAKADIEKMGAGMITLSSVLAKLGVDRDEHFDEMESDLAEIERRGLPIKPYERQESKPPGVKEEVAPAKNGTSGK